jgi:hypothetical protein
VTPKSYDTYRLLNSISFQKRYKRELSLKFKLIGKETDTNTADGDKFLPKKCPLTLSC